MGKNKSKRTGGNIFSRLLGNKNTVTLLGLLACIAVLVIGYNYRVNLQVSPKVVPYAKQAIPARTLITSDMVGKIKVSSSYVDNSENIISDMNELLNNKYSSYKTDIPAGSLFYSEQVKNADEMPDYAFSDIDDGYTVYSLAVDVDTTYANSIRAGDYIDLYMSTTDPDNDNKVIYGAFIESIRVLAVKDASGHNITKNSVANGTPSELLFAVEDEMYLLLMQSEFVNGVEINLVPVLRNQNYTAKANATEVSSAQLQAFIQDRVTVLR